MIDLEEIEMLAADCHDLKRHMLVLYVLLVHIGSKVHLLDENNTVGNLIAAAAAAGLGLDN